MAQADIRSFSVNCIFWTNIWTVSLVDTVAVADAASCCATQNFIHAAQFMQRYRFECKMGSKKEWGFKKGWLTGRQIKECKNLRGPIYSLCRLRRSPQIKHGLFAHLVSQWVMPACWSWTVLWGARTKKRMKKKNTKVRLTCSQRARFVVGKSQPAYANVPTSTFLSPSASTFSSGFRQTLTAAPVVRLRHVTETTPPPHVHPACICRRELQIKLLARRLWEKISPHNTQDTPSPDSDYPASHSTL